MEIFCFFTMHVKVVFTVENISNIPDATESLYYLSGSMLLMIKYLTYFFHQKTVILVKTALQSIVNDSKSLICVFVLLLCHSNTLCIQVLPKNIRSSRTTFARRYSSANYVNGTHFSSSEQFMLSCLRH